MKSTLILGMLICLFALTLPAQDSDKEDKSVMTESTFSGMKLRSVGPAFASGRIADIAVHPDDENMWYVAVGSGGVWKTTNAGMTWKPIFDDQSVYSTGCITIDPSDHSKIWLGTGENVGGRHVGYGDGVYFSPNDGKSWKNMGLKETQHISKIVVHPENSDIVWVAAQGPLWNSGGERGLYKTVDGGINWTRTLGNDEWTGVTDIAIDPRNPDVLYAATWDRHRTVAAYMGGGPGSGIHKSTDGGDTWEQLSKGLPSSNLGKIGIAISPQKPDVLYAAIELDRKTGAVYKSTNRGASWSKQSDAVSGATGPHYYQELYACPHHFDRIYLMDVRVQVSDNGGKTFRKLSERGKHSDNHAIVFRADDPDYLLIGADGGLYESYDLAQNWRFIDNMPLTQYYKLSVDDRKPFYHIFGGTQDNGSHGGPSRTDNYHGIRNADWYKTLGSDGHGSATEPGNQNIVYAETQQGGLHRVDLSTGDQVFIQPQSGKDENYERYNWDAPILVSPHSPTRLYFASQRVWRSDNRGDSWIAISEDLTRNEDRITLPIMGGIQSWDNAWDVSAMSNYNTITSLAESPLQEGLIYAGTDDGILQITEDGGTTWTKIEVGAMPEVPATAFVNNITADLYDSNTVYVALDNHKYGDLDPYLLKSTDRGNSWTSISGNIPEKTIVWRVVQDHVKPELMFAATEFGIYFTVDGGDKWVKLTGGVPTISFRDIVIQRSQNDLVAASFGRSFYILDDYSALREVSEDSLTAEATLYTPRPALWYSPRSIVSSQGAAKYSAKNPPFGATFTYHVAEGFKSMKSERKSAEKELKKEGEEVPFPGWDVLEAEKREQKAKMVLTVKDSKGNVVRRIDAPSSKGMHRVTWDLRYASKSVVRLEREKSGQQGFHGRGGGGNMATTGSYTATLAKHVDGNVTDIAGPVSFEVVPLRQGALEGASNEKIIAFRGEVEAFQSSVSAASYSLNLSKDKVRAMKTALSRSDVDAPELVTQLYDLNRVLEDLDTEMNGTNVKSEIGERTNPTIRSRMYTAMRGLWSTYGPTPLHEESLSIAQEELASILPRIKKIEEDDIPRIEKALENVGAPWIEGMSLPKN
jgi:photosystem II stability/assembly factor-like uncharacterized protein